MKEKNEIKNDSIIKKNDANNIIEKEDKLSLALDSIKQDIHNFLYKSKDKGYHFSIKLNEKIRKIKIFVTLKNSTDVNLRPEDIDFLIVANEEYPKKAPNVFSLSCVKL